MAIVVVGAVIYMIIPICPEYPGPECPDSSKLTRDAPDPMFTALSRVSRPKRIAVEDRIRAGQGLHAQLRRNAHSLEL